MSKTLAQVRTGVRYHLRDFDQSKPVFIDPEVNKAIGVNRLVVAGLTYIPHAWSNADFTTSASTDTYVITGATQVQQVLAVVNASDGIEVELVSRAEFQAMRYALKNPSLTPARPLYGTLIESTSQAVSIQFHPWPDGAYAFNVLRALMPADPGHTDATAIGFDDHAIAALEARSAAYLAAKASPEELARLKVSPSIAETLIGLAMQEESNSRIRRRRLAATGHTRKARRW